MPTAIPKSHGLLVLLAMLMPACGDSTPPAATRPTSPMSPTSPTPPGQRTPPQVDSVTVTPTLCVPSLTTLQGHVVAHGSTDEPLTIAWSAPPYGLFATGADVSFPCMGRDAPRAPYPPVTVTVTASDGSSAKQDVPFVDADFSGSYTLTIGPVGTTPVSQNSFSLWLWRKGTRIFGNINGDPAPGVVDPAEPGTIDADGHFRIRLKLHDDFTIIGQMVIDPTPPIGYSARFYGTGRIQDGPFNGQPFVIRLNDPY